MINLSGGWAKVWGAVSGAAPGLSGLLTGIGVVLIVFAFLKWVWGKRRGGGGDSSSLTWTLALGAVFAGPQIIIPIVLKFIDMLVNTVVKFFA